MRAIPIPIRKRILELYEQGKSTREIAQFSGFCIAAVRRVRQQFRQRRTLEPRTHWCGRKTLLTYGYGATRPWKPGGQGLPALA